ncbi:MAG: DsrE family protein [Bacteroidales bacterium]|nr:DsrE family protein [Bacteroidales bacterium]
MSKVAIVVLADKETHGDMGRIANALEVAKELKEGNDDVKIVFDGAGTRWIGELANGSNQMNPLFEAIKDNVDGACYFCAGAFGVRNEVEKAGVPFLDDYDGHPSIKNYIDKGYQIITF